MVQGTDRPLTVVLQTKRCSEQNKSAIKHIQSKLPSRDQHTVSIPHLVTQWEFAINCNETSLPLEMEQELLRMRSFFGARPSAVCKTHCQVMQTELILFSYKRLNFFFPKKKKKRYRNCLHFGRYHMHVYHFSNPLTSTLKRGLFRNKQTKKSKPCSKAT